MCAKCGYSDNSMLGVVMVYKELTGVYSVSAYPDYARKLRTGTVVARTSSIVSKD